MQKTFLRTVSIVTVLGAWCVGTPAQSLPVDDDQNTGGYWLQNAPSPTYVYPNGDEVTYAPGEWSGNDWGAQTGINW